MTVAVVVSGSGPNQAPSPTQRKIETSRLSIRSPVNMRQVVDVLQALVDLRPENSDDDDMEDVKATYDEADEVLALLKREFPDEA